MKKVISVILLVVVLTFSFVSCVGTPSENGTNDQGTGTAGGSSTKSNLGDYNVVIESCRLAEDYTGKPIVIVKYIFTNNSDEPEAFSWSVDDNVYQDGIGLNGSYVTADSADYSSDNQTKEIKPGATLEVEVAYELNDTTTDIEVEVSEMFSWGEKKKVTKTFTIN